MIEQGGSPNANTTGGALIVTTRVALTASSPTSATVGVVSAQALSANPSRKGLSVVNTSSNTVSLAFGTTAVINKGITLTPFSTFDMDDYSYTTAAMNAIADGASSNLSIQEYI